MKFIPDRIKKLFSKKSRKQEATPAPAEADTAPAPEPVQEKPAPVHDRTGELAGCKTPEGNYLVDLDVKVLGRNNGQYMHMITGRDTDFQLALFSFQYLSGVKTLAMEVEDHMSKAYGFDVGHVFFKRKDANFYFDGYDELLGLPPGDGFQIVLVPEGSDWRPQFAPPPMHAIPGTGTILQHPATLLPQFSPQVVYPIMFVNGMDMSIRDPQLPAMPKAPKPEEKKPEEKPADAVAQPAAALPPPPPKI